MDAGERGGMRVNRTKNTHFASETLLVRDNLPNVFNNNYSCIKSYGRYDLGEQMGSLTEEQSHVSPISSYLRQ